MSAATRGARGRDRRAPWLFLAPFGVLFFLLFVLPIIWAVVQSFTGVRRVGKLGLQGSETFFAGFANYAHALTQTTFPQSLVRIAIFGVVEVPAMIICATVLALLLDSSSARWPRFFRATFFLPYGIPGVIASILWSFLYLPGLSPILSVAGKLGLNIDFLDGGGVLWSIANIVTWEFVGYNMLVIVAQLQAVPPDLYDAAHVDGANAWQLVWHIKLPLIRPAVVLTTVFTIIGTLQLFAEPMVLKPYASAINFRYMPNVSAYNEAFTYQNYGLAAAEAVLLAVTAFVLSFGFLRLVGRGGPNGR